ncbi:hypothetical protein GXM18_27110 [Blautia producta ATCC 27340 = DSM 2950]|uniref:Uncharacterized protein n=1 Tax=Blautia producta ATCC 27340 = DSM 2950 TaxID=1121114 RepID=A0ABX6J400_9FIRM|nr:hypothetical protein GXM18_27110 [Blautia producta ATCC 27340 = DSM 2950]
MKFGEVQYQVPDEAGHSLRGECGLKYQLFLICQLLKHVTLCEESVD